MIEDWDSDNGLKNIKIFRHHIPRNQEELKLVKEIIKTQDVFDKKLAQIYQKLDSVFRQIDYKKINVNTSIWVGWLERDIYNMIRNLFADKLTDKPWTLPELISSEYPSFIHDRKFSCEICGENRVTEKCHILPRRMGGSLALENIFILCPTHHSLFDRYLLSKAEFSKLNISDKSPSAIKYFNDVIEPNMKKFWETSSKQNYKQEKAFREGIRKEVVDFIIKHQPLEEREIIKQFAYAFKEAEYIINDLKIKNILLRNDKNKYFIDNKRLK